MARNAAPLKIAILGAGPIGIEAALHGARSGHDIAVYERDVVAGNVRRWGHIRLFSTWKLNCSELGLAELRQAGGTLPDAEAFPTGHDLVDSYLVPLALSRLLAGRIHEGCRIVQIGRRHIGKRGLRGDLRTQYPFRMLAQDERGEHVLHPDVVIDCTGTYGNHNWMGSGNIPALGERSHEERITYLVEDLAGSLRTHYEGRRVLIVGGGYSAATALELLLGIDGVTIVWVVRSHDAGPLPIIDNDPLPERQRLTRMANLQARGTHPRVDFRNGTSVESISEVHGDLVVTLDTRGSTDTIRVDRVLALVGYAPDSSMYRELHVHECYATEGPMSLAATLATESSTDCLAQESPGADVLRTPEPGFFILGAKSYGRNSSFLIRMGLEQVRQVYSLIEKDLRHRKA